MNVLLLPLVLVAWVALSAWAACRTGERLAERGGPDPTPSPVAGRRLELKALMFLALLPLPLIDELLARPQFEALCREQAAVVRHPGLTPGRTVYRVDLPPEPVPGLVLPVRSQRQLYLDDETHQPLASIHTLEAAPGKLARLTGHRHGPLTFDGSCGPARPQDPLAALGLQLRGPESGGRLHATD